MEVRGFSGCRLTAARVRNEDWDFPDLKAIEQRIANTWWAGHRFGGDPFDLQAVVTVNTVSTEATRTYGFRTDKGALGLLQFLEYTDAPGGKIKFRYKLFKNAPNQLLTEEKSGESPK